MKNIIYSLIIIAFSSTLATADSKIAYNGVFVDKDNAVEWQDDYSDNQGIIQYLDWASADRYCKALRLDGGDWRLPTLAQLRTFVKQGKFEKLKAIKSEKTVTIVNNYWTETEYEKDNKYAWRVSILYHNVYYFKKANATNVRCAREIK